MADRGIAAVADHAERDLGRVDVGHDDPLRARVEHARGVEMLEARHPHDRRDARVLGRDAELRREVDRHRAVLHVDEQEIVARGLHQLADLDRARQAQAYAERQLARLQALLGKIADADHGPSPVRRCPSPLLNRRMVRRMPVARRERAARKFNKPSLPAVAPIEQRRQHQSRERQQQNRTRQRREPARRLLFGKARAVAG